MSIITSTPGQRQVIKRTGEIATFNAEKISVAIGKAFLAVEGQQGADSSRIHDRISQLTEMVMNTFKRRLPSGGTIHIEEIQDQVELALMRTGEQKVARAYVIYREQRATARQQTGANHHPTLQITDHTSSSSRPKPSCASVMPARKPGSMARASPPAFCRSRTGRAFPALQSVAALPFRHGSLTLSRRPSAMAARTCWQRRFAPSFAPS